MTPDRRGQLWEWRFQTAWILCYVLDAPTPDRRHGAVILTSWKPGEQGTLTRLREDDLEQSPLGNMWSRLA